MKISTDGLVAAALPVLREHGVLRAGVFGSHSRGEGHSESDLDILVELPEGASLLDLVGLEQAVSDHIGLKAHVVTYRSLHPLLRERILSTEVPILP